MRVRNTPRGPFSEQPYFSENDIDTLCLDELSRCNLLPSAPRAIRIDRFIEKRFGKPHSYEDLPDGVLGLTRFGGEGVQEVVVARGLEEDISKPAERRLRTTLAHEAGHGLLHAHLFVLGRQKPLFGDWTESKKPKVLCRDPALYKGDWWEYQANMVMGSILLPKSLVTMAVEPFLTIDGLLALPTLSAEGRSAAIRALAEVFDVNPIVVRIRLEKLFPERSTAQLTL
jgi:hypothetical protein